MDAFWFTNAGYPPKNASGRAGDMEESIQVDKIISVILDEYISATKQVQPLFKSVPQLSLIKHVKSAGLIVPKKEIKVVVFLQTSIKTIIKEALRKKVPKRGS